jgi:glycosyltransferase involved in cell wall biosynthesis
VTDRPAGASVVGRHVVVINWRDPWHPAAGGAETYAWRAAVGLRRRGATVTYLTSRAPGQRRHDRVDGVEVVRGGGRWTVYLHALLWLTARRRCVDAVLDCENGIPFFSPLVVRRRTAVVLVVHHVHDAQFGQHFPAAVAAVGRMLEGPAMRRVYRQCLAVAVSPSTARALRERLRWAGAVLVVPNGIDIASTGVEVVPTGRDRRAPSGPRVLVLGRLAVHKRVPAAIGAALSAADAHPGLQVDVVGGGHDNRAVRAAAGPRVRVHGRVADATKHALVHTATLHVTASGGEGWGLTVLECAAAGVPTVALDVDGLRDSIRAGSTGWLADDLGELPAAVCRALDQLAAPAERDRVAAECRAWAACFSWEDTVERLALALDRAVAEGRLRRRHHPAAVVRAADPAAARRIADRLGAGTRTGSDAVGAWVLVEERSVDAITAAVDREPCVSVAAAPDLAVLLGGPVRAAVARSAT